MSTPNPPDSPADTETTESFDAILSAYEKSHAQQASDTGQQMGGTVIAVSADSVFLDIGRKLEGILPLAAMNGEPVKPGDKLAVSMKGFDPEGGYYALSRLKVAQPKDWSALELAFGEKSTIAGTVTAMVKGGFSVDVGVRAFMPASRSGAREPAEMEKLVGQEIRCRIIKLDATEEDVVVDRRVVAEEEERSTKERRYSEVREGDTVRGQIRSLTDYGAFVDIGGVDGLLHVGDISWGRVHSPSDVLSVGQEVEAKVLKIDPDKHRIALGLKQLQPHPWDAVPGKYTAGGRVRGIVTRVADFGAFVELEPGVEGLIHLSEMSWAKKVRKPGDVVKPGDRVEAVVLSVNLGEHRISLGLKQALGDPWAEVPQKFPVGSVVEGPVISFTKFGAFVQLSEGVEGMIHVSEISAEKRINHPQDVLRLGQPVKAQVLAIDTEKRQLRLSIKQMVPQGIDEYLVEHRPGDPVTGRILEITGTDARVELGEGIYGACHLPETNTTAPKSVSQGDLSALTSMLQARWKGGAPAHGTSNPEPASPGQIRSFKITRLDADAKKIELDLVQ